MTEPTVLITTTTQWEFPARVATAFGELGWQVHGLCGTGNALHDSRAVRELYHYRALRPADAVRGAIEACAPDLIVPCDDRALDHLLTLQVRLIRDGETGPAAAISRSLGDPAASQVTQGRASLIALARAEGVRAPLTIAVDNRQAMQSAIDATGLKAVIKVDGSWGGEGVAVAASREEADHLFVQLSRRPLRLRALKRLIVNRDPFPLLPSLRGDRPRLNIQAYVDGHPANCLCACQDGEVLAILQAAVERTTHDNGPSAIIRVIDHPEIGDAARRVIGALRLSGFIGLDFMIETGTGAPHLIEMNRRMTPTGHLALGEGRDPVAALSARLEGARAGNRLPVTHRELIALFPMAWQVEPKSPLLGEAYHDIPWSDPGLVEALSLPPYDERGLLARLIDGRLRGRRGPGTFDPVSEGLLVERGASGWPETETAARRSLAADRLLGPVDIR